MGKSTEEILNEKLISISDILSVPVSFVEDTSDEGKAKPAFSCDAIISKLLALYVYSGLLVPGSFAPAYNRVHADIEFWKQYLEKETNLDELPKEEVKPDGASQS